MKGRLLAFDAAAGSGIITGEDGARHTFAGSEWKNAKPPAVGDEVDFVSSSGLASEVYVTRAAGLLGSVEVGDVLRRTVSQAEGALDRAAKSDSGMKAIEWVRTRPQIALAAAILIAAFILPWCSLQLGAYETSSISSSLVGFPGKMSSVKHDLAPALEMADQTVDQMSRSPFGQPATTVALRDHISSLRLAMTLLSASYLLWLIPVGAAYLVFREWKRKPLKVLELSVGVGAVVSAVLFFVMRSAIASGLAGATDSSLERAMSLSFGGWLIALLGVGLILTSLGIIKSGVVALKSPIETGSGGIK